MRALFFSVCLLASLLTGCESGLIDNPSFDRWCGDELCDWKTEVGKVERVGSWHKLDYAASFVDTPTRISQLSMLSVRNTCIRFDLIADVDPRAQLVLRVNFNDDESIEQEQLVTKSNWETSSFVIRTPRSFKNVRYTFEKKGEGRAVIAQLWADYESDCAPTP